MKQATSYFKTKVDIRTFKQLLIESDKYLIYKYKIFFSRIMLKKGIYVFSII